MAATLQATVGETLRDTVPFLVIPPLVGYAGHVLQQALIAS